MIVYQSTVSKFHRPPPLLTAFPYAVRDRTESLFDLCWYFSDEPIPDARLVGNNGSASRLPMGGPQPTAAQVFAPQADLEVASAATPAAVKPILPPDRRVFATPKPWSPASVS